VGVGVVVRASVCVCVCVYVQVGLPTHAPKLIPAIAVGLPITARATSSEHTHITFTNMHTYIHRYHRTCVTYTDITHTHKHARARVTPPYM